MADGRDRHEKARSVNPPVSVHIRPATRADLPGILQIERAARTAAHWTKEDYERALVDTSPQRVLLVAESASVPQELFVQGFFVARAVHAAEWEIENVVVAEPARRLGLGAALLKAFLERVRAEKSPESVGCDIFLEVRESNIAARRLYEKSGFVVDRRREGYYSHPSENAVLYHLLFQ